MGWGVPRCIVGYTEAPPCLFAEEPPAAARSGSGFAAPRLPPPGPGAVAMHGRLKLRPPDASHLLKRQQKLRLFLDNMAALRDKRSRGELDADLLEVTGSILAANPEMGTAWSLRRRLLGALGHHWQEEELRFVSACLSRSPKSYGCWQHRGWVQGQTDTKPPPISTGMLDSDPRNFHAWEHRWALEADPDPEIELGFTGTLLGRDFSNFSAWNHRLRILRRTPGSLGQGGAGTIPPERLRQELELVQNAVFTDPNDQSAWVYLRCLLSRGPTPPRIIWVHANLEDATVAVTFSRPLWVGEGLTLTLDGSVQEGAWRSGEGRPRPSHTWLFDLPPFLASPPSHILVTWASDPTPRQLKLRPGETEAWWREPIASRDLFWPEVGVADPELLQEVVGTCRELLELEPQSRGCLLTLSLLLGALDAPGNGPEIQSMLRELQEADPLRGGFIDDLRSRAEVALGLLEAELGQGGGACELRLPGKALTSLPLLEWAGPVAELDLSRNRLRGIPKTVGALRRLRVLDLSLNEVTTLQGFPPLPHLEELDLHGNPIGDASALTPLAACPQLRRIRLADTPLAAAPDRCARLAELLPQVTIALT